MTDFDYSWKNPTEPQLAALDYACRALGTKPMKQDGAITHHFMVTSEALGRSLAVDAGVSYKSGMSEYDYAELILLAEHSLWYVEASNKASESSACKFIVDVVSLGYKNGKWWDVSLLDNAYVENGKKHLSVLGILIRRGLNPFMSQGILPVIDLILGKKWFSNIKKSLRDKLPYKATKCIKPDCENMVAPIGKPPQEGHLKNYRATGACMKGHNGYQCTKCNLPHSYISKIGKKHLVGINN